MSHGFRARLRRWVARGRHSTVHLGRGMDSIPKSFRRHTAPTPSRKYTASRLASLTTPASEPRDRFRWQVALVEQLLGIQTLRVQIKNLLLGAITRIAG